MLSRRALVTLLARLDASPLPRTDGTRVELERELLDLLEAHSPARRRQTQGLKILRSPNAEKPVLLPSAIRVDE